MKRSGFSEEQIIAILKEQKAGLARAAEWSGIRRAGRMMGQCGKGYLRDACLNETLFTSLAYAGSCLRPSGTSTTWLGRIRNWAESPRRDHPRMPHDTLPSHQTNIMKERDSNSDR